MEIVTTAIQAGNHRDAYQQCNYLLSMQESPFQSDKEKEWIFKSLIVSGIHSGKFDKILKFIARRYCDISVKGNSALEVATALLNDEASLKRIEDKDVLFYVLYSCYRLPGFPLTLLQVALERQESTRMIALLRAQVYYKLDKFSEADKIYEHLKAHNPSVDSVLFEVNQSAYQDMVDTTTFEIAFNKSLRAQNSSEALTLLERAEEMARDAGEDVSDIITQRTFLQRNLTRD